MNDDDRIDQLETQVADLQDEINDLVNKLTEMERIVDEYKDHLIDIRGLTDLIK